MVLPGFAVAAAAPDAEADAVELAGTDGDGLAGSEGRAGSEGLAGSPGLAVEAVSAGFACPVAGPGDAA